MKHGIGSEIFLQKARLALAESGQLLRGKAAVFGMENIILPGDGHLIHSFQFILIKEY